MEWASADNAASLGLSASRFIILSYSVGSPPARPTEETGCSGPLPTIPSARGPGLRRTELYLSLPSLPSSLARTPKGLPQRVINFTFSVCRRGERRRLRPSSGQPVPEDTN